MCIKEPIDVDGLDDYNHNLYKKFEIDYSQQAISIFSEIIQDIIFFLEKENDATEFKFKSYDKIVIKHEKIIKKLDYEKEKTDEERNDLAKKYVNIKQKKLNELLRK